MVSSDETLIAMVPQVQDIGVEREAVNSQTKNSLGPAPPEPGECPDLLAVLGSLSLVFHEMC